MFGVQFIITVEQKIKCFTCSVRFFLPPFQVTVYQCLEGGVIAVLQSYIDEDVRPNNL